MVSGIEAKQAGGSMWMRLPDQLEENIEIHANKAATTLERYRIYLEEELGITKNLALSLTPDNFSRLQAYFLVLAPELLSSIANDLPLSTRELLAISAYARFRSVVSLDTLLDGKDPTPRPFHAYETIIHLEAASRSATSAGVSLGRPQQIFLRLARTYLKTLQVENNVSATEMGLARVLFRKSSMVLLPVEWARHFGANSRTTIRGRAAAIKLFIALQLFDDVMDLERDIAQGQNTLLRSQLCRRYPLADSTKWTVFDSRVREMMIDHLKIAERKAASAAALYEQMNSTTLAECCRGAATTILTLRTKLRAYEAR